MNPQNKMKNRTIQALTTWTFDLDFATVAKEKSSSFIKTLKVIMIPINTK